MIPTAFFGGADTQDSLNHSDSRCINLYPTVNDDGSIKAFYAAPGLKQEVANPSSAIGKGLYTASNGRCFEVVGTTLYEVTSASGVLSLTSRGTITAGDDFRMSDNGLEMMIVQGVDGWIFTFATNVLKQLKVLSAAFTVSIASPAVFTATDHGLVAGDAILLSSTEETVASDGILTPIDPPAVSAASNPSQIISSDDGLYIYSLNREPVPVGAQITTTIPSILQFLKNEDGTLSPLSPRETPLCTSAILALWAPRVPFSFTPTISDFQYHDLVGSPDGNYVYALFSLTNSQLGYGASYIERFSRNIISGELTYSGLTEIYNTTTKCNAMVISDDGESAYVANTAANTVSQYSISTGALTPLSPATIAVTSPTRLCIAADGNGVYVLGNTNYVYQFIRNTSTKLLSASTPASILTDASLTCTDITCAPDSKGVYVTAYLTAGITSPGFLYSFSRSLTTPFNLTMIGGTYSAFTGLNPKTIIISADNANAYVTGFGNNTVTIYTRNETTFSATMAGLPLTTETSPYGICITPDDANVYVANFNSGSIQQYKRSAEVASVGLPAGLNEDTVYYVITAGLTSSLFQASETDGGDAVNTSGVQAGVHTFETIGYGFPNGAKTISYMNGRFIACEPNTQNFFVSDVLDGFTWQPINVQTVDSNPDMVVGQVVNHNELIVFCEQSGEAFYDEGEYPTPFVRNKSGVFEIGCAAPYSIAKIDNSCMWLGKSSTGQGIIYRLNGYTPTRVSTYSIENAIREMTDISDAKAFSYQISGHHFYIITFPTGNKTFAYDVNTSTWHELARFADGSFSRWPAEHYAFFAGKHLVCGTVEGVIFSIDPDTHAYGSEVRKWLRSFRVPTRNMDRVRHAKLTLEAEVGVGVVGGDEPEVMLKLSNDGGHTWSSDIWRSLGIGAVGEYAKRVVWHRLGITSGQSRIYEISGTAAVKTALLKAHLE